MVRISVQVSGPETVRVRWTLFLNSSYESIEVADFFLGVFQLELLHLGQNEGSCSESFGIHSWLHRSQRQPMTVIGTLAIQVLSGKHYNGNVSEREELALSLE